MVSSSSALPVVPPWGQRVKEKRQVCRDAIPEAWRLPQDFWEQVQTPLQTSRNNFIALAAVQKSGILSDREVNITEHKTVAALLGELASGQITATEAITAFSKRAAIAQQLTNCLTETYFPEAKNRAVELDNMREAGQLAGPLHGLPISLKDSFQIIGSEATIGMVAFLGQKSTTNSALVDLLINLGAVLYCKSNVPQTMMTADSDNNIFGRTLNPWNTSLCAGGSSGGEGALISMRGAPIGVGTDIAASCCGTYGFKPTACRIPYGNQRGCSNPGFRPIPACAGPLANDIESLGIFMKAVVSARPRQYDSTAIDVPWRKTSFSKAKLRFGVVAEDPRFPLHPPVKAALDSAARLIEAQGHEIIHLSPNECRIDHAAQVAWSLFSLDDTSSRLVAHAGEPPIPSRLLLQQVVRKIGMEFVADANSLSELQRLAALTVKKAEVVDSWNKLWNVHQLDAVISPSAQNSAVKHDEFNFPPYTMFLNLLDYPACVIPFGKDAGTSPEFKIEDGQIVPNYNPKDLEGSPLSIQVFTSSMRDEECLDIAKVVDDCLGGGNRDEPHF
ncbi:hypothetical protein QQS21_002552 [Conoideocrella luteorostrata]|uniref:Amidase domain-containing protein n=1 Tax=Conoideocrella luteorostrata TaxID=1105319 RepID=A0AAJ0G166_9HYPO|nr:hypothetical protein QQS21_002552 [Conoideocrella luteorostrata]